MSVVFCFVLFGLLHSAHDVVHSHHIKSILVMSAGDDCSKVREALVTKRSVFRILNRYVRSAVNHHLILKNLSINLVLFKVTD